MMAILAISPKTSISPCKILSRILSDATDIEKNDIAQMALLALWRAKVPKVPKVPEQIFRKKLNAVYK